MNAAPSDRPGPQAADFGALGSSDRAKACQPRPDENLPISIREGGRQDDLPDEPDDDDEYVPL